jgi:hypothetical protein
LITARRAVTAGVSVAAGLLVVASMAWACTVAIGSTWYTDGTTSKAGPPGTVISAFATGATQGVPYKLVLGSDGGDPGHASHACMVANQVLNDTVVIANSRGRLPVTSGTVGNIAKQTYQLCFKDSSPNNSTGTGGASFTVI